MRRCPKLLLDFSVRYQLSFRVFVSQNDAHFLISFGFRSSRSPATSRHCLQCECQIFDRVGDKFEALWVT